ncbi:MAG: M1 family metallopeptidase [Bacteroidales bacterium]|nr:M1 family metallopeptidase [Bacteroidales bacterium]
MKMDIVSERGFRFSFFLIFLLILIGINHLTAQEKTITFYVDPAAIPPDLPITIKHLTAHIQFQPEKNLVKGNAEFTFLPNRHPIDTIVFFAPGFKVSSVKLNGREIKYHHSGSNLVIDPGTFDMGPSRVTRHTSRESLIQIDYSASPHSGAIYFIGWQPEEAGKRKQIWAHRPHGWIPYMDGRITVDMFITFDNKFKVFSNGERKEVIENVDGTKTWHYVMKKDHPFFSTALVIGDYNYKSAKTSRGVPLEFWYYSDMPDRVGTTYMYSEQMFDFLEEELGFNYPYPLYRQAPVIDYMYGAMETTTSTIFGDYMQITPRAWWQRNYVNVNAHELAHQWFGNCIVHFVNRDVWLTESFATYYAKMFEKSIYGEDYYQNIRNDEMHLAFEAANKNDFPVGGSRGGVQRIYQKGSLVLGMLRDIMGDRGFQDAMHHYLEKYAFGYAETNDFIRCVYEATGKPYNWFFDQWILRGGEPEFIIKDSVSNDSLGHRSTLFKVWQVQNVSDLSGLFKVPVEFEVHYKDGSSDRLKTWIEDQYTLVAVPNPHKKPVEFMLFDPNRKILKKVKFTRPFEQLMAQAQKPDNMIDRYDAWVALRPEPILKKSKTLITAFHKETFWLIRSEILQQLASDNSPESVECFRQALLDKDAHVRKAALLALNPVPDLLQSTVEGLLFDSSYLNVEYAMEALCVSFPGHIDYYLDLTQDMIGWRGKNIRMMWLAVALNSGKKEFLAELISYCSPKYEFETRMNAFNLLKKINYVDAESLRYAEIAGKHWNNKLSSVAKEYLKIVK